MTICLGLFSVRLRVLRCFLFLLEEEWLERWRLDYSLLVNTRLAPAWERSFFVAFCGAGVFPSSGAELVTGLVETQREALWALIDRAVQ